MLISRAALIAQAAPTTATHSTQQPDPPFSPSSSQRTNKPLTNTKKPQPTHDPPPASTRPSHSTRPALGEPAYRLPAQHPPIQFQKLACKRMSQRWTHYLEYPFRDRWLCGSTWDEEIEKDECVARQEGATRGMRRRVCVRKRAWPSRFTFMFWCQTF